MGHIGFYEGFNSCEFVTFSPFLRGEVKLLLLRDCAKHSIAISCKIKFSLHIWLGIWLFTRVLSWCVVLSHGMQAQNWVVSAEVITHSHAQNLTLIGVICCSTNSTCYITRLSLLNFNQILNASLCHISSSKHLYVLNENILIIWISIFLWRKITMLYIEEINCYERVYSCRVWITFLDKYVHARIDHELCFTLVPCTLKARSSHIGICLAGSLWPFKSFSNTEHSIATHTQCNLHVSCGITNNLEFMFNCC